MSYFSVDHKGLDPLQKTSQTELGSLTHSQVVNWDNWSSHWKRYIGKTSPQRRLESEEIKSWNSPENGPRFFSLKMDGWKLEDVIPFENGSFLGDIHSFSGVYLFLEGSLRQ